MSTRKPARVEENVNAIDLKLDSDTNKEILSIIANDPSPEASYKSVSYWYQKNIVKNSLESETIYPPSPEKF